MNKNISQGELVVSTAGHDKGQLLVVLEIKNGYVMLSNGKTRKVSAAKKKKLKHIKSTGIIFDWVKNTPEKINNTSIKNAIKNSGINN